MAEEPPGGRDKGWIPAIPGAELAGTVGKSPVCETERRMLAGKLLPEWNRFSGSKSRRRIHRLRQAFEGCFEEGNNPFYKK